MVVCGLAVSRRGSEMRHYRRARRSWSGKTRADIAITTPVLGPARFVHWGVMRLSPPAAAELIDVVRFGVHVQLVRPNAAGDVSHVYQLLWQPGLWGEGAVVEVCGRSGQAATSHLTRYPSRAHAQDHVVPLLLRLVRQGFEVTAWE